MMRTKEVSLALGALTLATTTFVASAANADSVVIQNVRVEIGDGTALENAAVYIDGDTIQKVAKSITPPRGARVIDGKGGVLTPGFVDVDGHVGVREVSMENATADFMDKRSPITPGFRPAFGYDPHSVRIPINRKEGVTRTVVAPDGGFLSGIGTWVPLTGALGSLPSVDDDAALYLNLEAGADHVGQARGAMFSTLMELVEEARLFRTNEKAYEKNGVRPLSLAPLHLRALNRALSGEIAMAVRVEKASEIVALLEFVDWVKTSSRGRDKPRVVVIGGTESWLLAPRLAKERVAVVIDPMENGPHSFTRLRTHENAAGILAKAGVDVVLFVSGWFENPRRLRQVAGNAVAQGMAREDAMRAVGQAPWTVFGTKADARKKRGLIAEGAPADVVLWSADPFELSTRARVVFIEGRAYSLDTRQDALARRYLRARKSAH